MENYSDKIRVYGCAWHVNHMHRRLGEWLLINDKKLTKFSITIASFIFVVILRNWKMRRALKQIFFLITAQKWLGFFENNKAIGQRRTLFIRSNFVVFLIHSLLCRCKVHFIHDAYWRDGKERGIHRAKMIKTEDPFLDKVRIWTKLPAYVLHPASFPNGEYFPMKILPFRRHNDRDHHSTHQSLWKKKESLKNFPLLLTRVRTNENKKSKNISIIRVSYYCLPFEYI